MKITLATAENLDAIMEMYNSCVQGMLALGIEQWDESYPNRTIIEQDLKEGCYYIGILNDEIIAGMRVDRIQDPTYLNVNWTDKSNNFMVGLWFISLWYHSVLVRQLQWCCLRL